MDEIKAFCQHGFRPSVTGRGRVHWTSLGYKSLNMLNCQKNCLLTKNKQYPAGAHPGCGVLHDIECPKDRIKPAAAVTAHS
eukprot:4186101-Pleurochrysis_carterae.AAC.1